MIEDDVIRGACRARGIRSVARLQHSRMVADLQARDSVGDWPVVSRPARRPKTQPTGTANPATQGSTSAEAVPGG